MKVSILIPIYGVERYITQCAQSLMEQSYSDIEYIFVNDCTPDSSIMVLKSVIESFPNRAQQVTIINHDANKGLAGARATGLAAATGQAVLFVDSDDYVAPGAVEALVNAMNSQEADIVDGGYSIVTGGRVVKVNRPLHMSKEKYLKTILCQNIEPNRIWGRLIKRELFIENDVAFTQGVDYCEDFSVLPRIMLFANRGWVDDTLYFYRDDNPDSYTNNITTKNAISFLRAQSIVGRFMSLSPHWNDYRFAAEIGWVNVWRFARKFGVDRSIVEEYFQFRPSCLTTRCLATLMKSPLPYKLVNFIYMALRRLYVSLLA